MLGLRRMPSAKLPPGPRGLPLLGNMLAMRKDPINFLLGSATAEPGDVVLYRLGLHKVFLLKHPDLVKEVLVTRQHDFAKGKGIQWAKLFLGEGLLTSEGELHTRQRRLAQPAFHRQRISAYGAVMTAHAVRTSDSWRDGATLDLDREMMTLTLAVAAKTLFDAELEGEAAEIGASLTTIIHFFPRFTLPFFGLLQKLPLPSNARFNRAVARLDETVMRIIAARRRSGEDRGDLLSMLLLAQDEDGSRMSDRQLRDEVITILLAGHETTANALTWTWYLLSQNPEQSAALGAELDRVLGDRVPTFEDLPALRYVEMVVAESMRIYPPAWGMGRRALRDVSLGGYEMRAGDLLSISPFVTHRDPRFWPEPHRFDPLRFTPEAKATRHKFAYFPFGGGARQCIGEPFAWMEAVLLLATLARRWRMRLVPGHPVVPEALITLRPRYGMKMTAETRRPGAA
jgi:cytochrome P450